MRLRKRRLVLKLNSERKFVLRLNIERKMLDNGKKRENEEKMLDNDN